MIAGAFPFKNLFNLHKMLFHLCQAVIFHCQSCLLRALQGTRWKTAAACLGLELIGALDDPERGRALTGGL